MRPRTSLSLWLSGLIRFLSHSTCWAYLAGDLQRPGIKSGSWHELSVGWTNVSVGQVRRCVWETFADSVM